MTKSISLGHHCVWSRNFPENLKSVGNRTYPQHILNYTSLYPVGYEGYFGTSSGHPQDIWCAEATDHIMTWFKINKLHLNPKKSQHF